MQKEEAILVLPILELCCKKLAKPEKGLGRIRNGHTKLLLKYVKLTLSKVRGLLNIKTQYRLKHDKIRFQSRNDSQLSNCILFVFKIIIAEIV